MRIVTISDTHKHHGFLDMPEGDILLHAGDFTDWGSFTDIEDFATWLRSLDYKHKVVIAGNHDVKFETVPEMCKFKLCKKKNIHYLDNESIELEGLKIFGSPYTPKFAGGFQLENEDEKEFWQMIPTNSDIVITHGPPFGIMDEVGQWGHQGSHELLNRILEVKPKLHLFGHIHEGYGLIKQRYGITFVNASIMNFYYNKLNKPIVIDI